ncbi:MMPL family transporter [Plantibacter sp. MCCC 1A11337]|uniref:MMPL family transporter n=1 Tax=Plantibacter sp. MCCC 1A11337 TaxID=2736644 RepID=UPI0015818583|nr:efflux RND transporter permease subunit [Plantibacter sp. MCCC 1A11337]NUJ89963.1 MMPL family transporter [Plantibacter sp. MCCC 1A11337]
MTHGRHGGTRTDADTRTQRRNRAGAPRWLRVVLPAVLILLWLTAAGVGGPYFGKVSEVATNDQTSFLPASADATEVQTALDGFREGDDIPALVLFVRDGGITDEDRAAIDDEVSALSSTEGVADGVSPAIPSEDGAAVEVFVPISGDAEVGDVVEAIRAQLAEAAPAGLDVFVTGPAGFTADLTDAFAGIDGILLLTALGAVFLILIVVYRSPVLPFLVLGTSLFALCTALLTVWWLAKAGVVLLNGQVQGILFILVIGAATDYSLLYVSRYREALRDHERRWDATWAALRGSFEPIVASGGTVIAGLLCLLLSDLNSNKALGPVASIGIVFSVLAALTFLPALLLACGRTSFWPLRPKYGSEHRVRASSTDGTAVPTTGLWGGIARLISRHARVVWIGSTLLLLVASLGVFQLKADGVAQSDLILGTSEARDGQAALGEHFPAGSASPVYVLTQEGDAAQVIGILEEADGLDSVQVLSSDAATGTADATVSDGEAVFTAPAAGPPGTPVASAEPTVDDGRVVLQATLDAAPDSATAEESVRQLRSTLDAEVGTHTPVGGVTATAVDSNDASIHDRNLIIPVVLAVILLILMLLLRSVLAPVLLILSVVVSFAAALGVSALVFDHVLGFPGADPSVPLYGFVFLVALGIDYNIFLMTRVREESLRVGTRAGVLRGLAITGGVITSAGLVLAATFAALGVIPILFLAQIAFIVAFGVLLDTIIVRTLLVPALSHDIGSAIWWPSKLAKGRVEHRHAA